MNFFGYDNFLIFPNKIRDIALNCEYLNCKQYTEKYSTFTDFPGSRSEVFHEIAPDISNSILLEISHLCETVFKISNVSIKSYLQLTTESDGYSWVHQDNNVDVAGILYLTPNPAPNSGTILYSCKNKSKWLSYMNDNVGYETLKTINENDNKELYAELFEPSDIIGNVYNRLIMYKGDTYHKSNRYFGTDKETGRLTLVFFITREHR